MDARLRVGHDGERVRGWVKEERRGWPVRGRLGVGGGGVDGPPSRTMTGMGEVIRILASDTAGEAVVKVVPTGICCLDQADFPGAVPGL